MSTRHIVYMGLSDLAPAARNPKNHDLASLVASLRRFGWVNPAVLDERTGRLTAGHGRREACIHMRESGEPPPGGVHVDDDGEWVVPVLRSWASHTDAEAEAFIIMDNNLSAAGGWYERGLAEMLEDVVTADAPLIETLGMSADDIDDLIARHDPETLGDLEEGDSLDGGPGEDLTIGGDDDPGDDDDLDPAAATNPPAHVCPSCGYEWEDQ